MDHGQPVPGLETGKYVIVAVVVFMIVTVAIALYIAKHPA